MEGDKPVLIVQAEDIPVSPSPGIPPLLAQLYTQSRVQAYNLYNEAVHLQNAGKLQAARQAYEAALGMKHDLKEARTYSSFFSLLALSLM